MLHSFTCLRTCLRFSLFFQNIGKQPFEFFYADIFFGGERQHINPVFLKKGTKLLEPVLVNAIDFIEGNQVGTIQ